MLSDRCLSVLSVCEVGVYCDQTVGWIKMKLGTQIGLALCHTVLDGDPAPKKGAQPPPTFRPMFIAAKRLGLDGSR